jgi:hypothetical protein
MNFSNIFEDENSKQIATQLEIQNRSPAHLTLVRSQPGTSPHPQIKTDDGEILTVVPGDKISAFNKEGEERFSEEFRSVIAEDPVATLAVGYEADETIGNAIEKIQRKKAFTPTSPKASFAENKWRQLNITDPSKSEAVSKVSLQWTDRQVEKLQSETNITTLGVFVPSGENNFELVNYNEEVERKHAPDKYREHFQRLEYDRC